MVFLKRCKFLLWTVLTFSFVQTFTAAYLPALRTKPVTRFDKVANIDDGQPATSLTPLGQSHHRVIHRTDDKRVLASRLLQKAASNKRRSLHDVLARPPDRSSVSFSQTSSSSRDKRGFQNMKNNSVQRRDSEQRLPYDNERSSDFIHSQQTDVLHTIATHLFPSRPNTTSYSAQYYYPSMALHIHHEDSKHATASTDSSSSFSHTSGFPRFAQKHHTSARETSQGRGAGGVQKPSTEKVASKDAATRTVRKAEGKTSQHAQLKLSSQVKPSYQKNAKVKNDFRRHGTTMPSDAEMEVHLLRQSIAALNTTSASEATAALRVLQELCHSIHNGRALEMSGGIERVLDVLASRHRRVRATALWAVATCCQNNPPVQKAALRNGAVQTLATIAWKDVLTVRARALFALNALLGMEEARETFENLPYATHVVIAALKDGRDFRATRRALNLIELLVGRNLDAWKTQLEAWDIPAIIERLMREHTDVDVRESAARIIAALDGKIVG